jgi:hypothetical protein
MGSCEAYYYEPAAVGGSVIFFLSLAMCHWFYDVYEIYRVTRCNLSWAVRVKRIAS